jgi:transposase InsO family protein
MELEQDLAKPAAGADYRHVGPAQPDVHMTILKTLLGLAAAAPGERLGPAGQRPRRDLEEVVRLRAARLAAQMVDEGSSYGEVARQLGVNERTLRSWRPAGRRDRAAVPRGRPLAASAAAQQQAVFALLDSVGPGLGVPALRTRFADLARAELDGLLKDYRRRWRADHPRLLHVLHWQRPGTVWAMDFAEAPTLIDGCFAYLLAVRDLASGQQLLWQPVAAPTAAVVLAELPLLFALHGAPLVLKTDNGSAFIADELRWYLRRCRVGQLFSPPRLPAYNGSIEASIGSLKRRTTRQCERAGHPGVWSGAAVQAAQVEANTTARPRRLNGLTPEHVWEARRLLTAEEREVFGATVEQYRRGEREARRLPAEELLRRREEASVDRVAFRRALVTHDLLLFRRRRIPPRISRPKSAAER